MNAANLRTPAAHDSEVGGEAPLRLVVEWHQRSVQLPHMGDVTGRTDDMGADGIVEKVDGPQHVAEIGLPAG